jgi:hypothetical protein
LEVPVTTRSGKTVHKGHPKKTLTPRAFKGKRNSDTSINKAILNVKSIAEKVCEDDEL